MVAPLRIMQHTGINTEPIELGQATMMVLRDEQGNIFEYTTSGGIKDGVVLFHGWKTPLVSAPLIQDVSIPQSKQIEELKLMVTCLVHMLGGAVNVSGWEYRDAQDKKLTVNTFRDPWGLILKVEDETR